jgi:hypothetical protein
VGHYGAVACIVWLRRCGGGFAAGKAWGGGCEGYRWWQRRTIARDGRLLAAGCWLLGLRVSSWTQASGLQGGGRAGAGAGAGARTSR